MLKALGGGRFDILIRAVPVNKRVEAGGWIWFKVKDLSSQLCTLALSSSTLTVDSGAWSMVISKPIKSSISSPFDAGSSTTKPIFVSVSVPTIKATRLASHDVFDELDKKASALIYSHPEHSDPQQQGQELPLDPVTALSDTTSQLYPGLSLSNPERERAYSPQSDLPAWLKETSRRVTAITAAKVPVAVTRTVRAELLGAGEGAPKLVRELRVVVGCEDGSLWIFAPPVSLGPEDGDGGVELMESTPTSPGGGGGPPSPSGSGSAKFTRKGSKELPRLSLERAASTSPSPSSPRSRGVSSPQLGPGSRRVSSANLPLPSLQRISSSSHVPSTSSSSSTSANPRKASATVSISVPLPMTANDDAPSSPTLSLVSPPPPTLSPPIGVRRSSHRGAKDSITTGIGLWEPAAAPSSAADEEGSSALFMNGPFSPRFDLNGAHEGEKEVLESLVPRVRIRTGGRGEIVQLGIVEGSLFSRGREGDRSLLVLRKSGYVRVLFLKTF